MLTPANVLDEASAWYLVHCKPRQDARAEENLLRQGYVCYRPTLRREYVRQGHVQILHDSLFPGYLFVQLSASSNWGRLRSTRGVNRLVAFNGYPLPVAVQLINQLHERSQFATEQLLLPGDKVRIIDGPFSGVDAIFQSRKGEERVFLLLNLLNKQQEIIEVSSTAVCPK